MPVDKMQGVARAGKAPGVPRLPQIRYVHAHADELTALPGSELSDVVRASQSASTSDEVNE